MKVALGTLGGVFVCFLLQSTLAPKFCSAISYMPGLSMFAGQTIDLVLLSLIYLALHRDRWGILIWAAVIGLMTGWFGPAWKGATIGSYMCVAVLCGLLSSHVFLASRSTIYLFAAVMTLIEGILHLQFGGALAQIPSSFSGQPIVILVQIVLNALFAPIVFAGFTRLDTWVGIAKDPNVHSELIIDI